MVKTKKVRISVIIILSLVLIIAILFGITEIFYGSRLRAVYSARIADADNSVFEVECNNTYDLDDLLNSENGATSGLRDYISNKILNGLPISDEDFGSACSCYSATNSDGEYVYGRNFDYDDSLPIVVHSVPSKGYKSISVSNLKFLGINKTEENITTKVISLAAPYFPLDGINEKGFAISVLMLDGNPTKQNTGKKQISTTVAIRMLLDKAATVEEAVELLNQYDMQSDMYFPYHFLISDANGDSAVIEYKKNDMNVIKSDKNFQICTNFWLSKNEPESYDNQCERYKGVDDLLTKTNGIVNSEKDGMDILKAVSQDTTQWSEYYNLSKRTVNFAVNKNFEDITTYSVDSTVGNSYPYYVEIIVWVVLAAVIVFLITKIKRKQK